MDLKKTIKDLWAAVSNRLRAHKLFKSPDRQLEIDDEGLISQEADATRSSNGVNLSMNRLARLTRLH